ncbi:MAG: hypothetical protein ACLFQS_10415 [Bacteroidales bacterium]
MMKTIKISLTAIFTLGIVFSGMANNFESFRMKVSTDQQIVVITKQEIICDQQEFNTREIYERHLAEKNTFEIKNFIKPEKELEEPLPMVK